MNIPPLFLAVRAVGAEFARRIYVPVLYGGIITSIALIALCSWLVTISAWWWIALTLVIFATLIFITLAVIAQFALRILRPLQSQEQKRAVRSFVDALQQTSEAVQTPKFVILFRLIKDILAPGKTTYINELSSTASSLRSGFKEVIALF